MWTREKVGMVILAATLDLFHQKIVGWTMGSFINQKLAVDALNMGIKNKIRGLGLSTIPTGEPSTPATLFKPC
ncbi:MAG: hypothetical protein IIA62_04260 [Nitrospinae bacterium]|nr:hypothetical protein [Nitrospinota bacterium]